MLGRSEKCGVEDAVSYRYVDVESCIGIFASIMHHSLGAVGTSTLYC